MAETMIATVSFWTATEDKEPTSQVAADGKQVTKDGKPLQADGRNVLLVPKDRLILAGVTKVAADDPIVKRAGAYFAPAG